MPRPNKCCRVCCIPGATYFKPAGIPLKMLEEIQLTVEEAEALRLKDLQGLEQEQGARQMNISRPTFQRVLAKARKKVADALLNGKAIRVEGGNYELISRAEQSNTGLSQLTNEGINMEGIMKIAVVTDDEVTICQHFGQAPYYTVLSVENGKITGKEKRLKAGHHVAGGHAESCHSEGGMHGMDAAAQHTHAGMIENITDCKVLIAGGMGYGAYESLKSYNIEPIITDVENIDEAVKLYIQGKLINLMEKLH
jgi:predicted DNA-binding protein (UPF0251 family)/predicted Fe-Mo cluster-binding NifX family protein